MASRASSTSGSATTRQRPPAGAPVRAPDAEDAGEVQQRRARPGAEHDPAERPASAGRSSRPPQRSRAEGGFREGERAHVLVLLPQHARPRALPPDPDDHPPRRGLDVMDRYAGACRSSSRGWPPAAAWSRSQSRPASTQRPARSRRRGRTRRIGLRRMSVPTTPTAARPADPRAAGTGRQLAALLAPRLQHRAQRIQTQVLRLGARLPWQVMRPLLLFGVLYVFFVLVFKVDKEEARAAHFYGVQLLGSIVLFTFFAEATSGASAAWSTARTSSARSSSRALRSRSRSCCWRSSTSG